MVYTDAFCSQIKPVSPTPLKEEKNLNRPLTIKRGGGGLYSGHIPDGSGFLPDTGGLGRALDGVGP